VTHIQRTLRRQVIEFACWRCNRHKGSDLTSFDPQTGQLNPLFNPRTQVWIEHFTYESKSIIGLTPEGRTTVHLLRLNSEDRLNERQAYKLGQWTKPPA
jgi:hypothetical protein